MSGCTEPQPVGGECSDSADCDDELTCIDIPDVGPQCMQDCSRSVVRICGGGEVCMGTDPLSNPDRPEDLGICFLGGSRAENETCESNPECAIGLICACTNSTDCGATPRVFRCVRACRVGMEEEHCEEGEACELLDETLENGYCVPDET